MRTHLATETSDFDVLVVGGGFAGMYAAIAAKRVGGPGFRVALLSRDDRLTVRPRLYEAEPETLVADLTEPLGRIGVELIIAVAEAVFDGSVRLSGDEWVSGQRLILACGSQMVPPSLPGLEHVHSVDDLTSAIRLERALASIARLPQPHLTVVGAGFCGVELALELRARLAGLGARREGGDARITLLDRRADPLAEFGTALASHIVAALAQDRVELVRSCSIARFTAGTVESVDGPARRSDCTILCTGLAAAPLATAAPGVHDDLGRLKVTSTLRVVDTARMFAAGDVAAAQCAPGRRTLMSCQHALSTGRVAGENAARSIIGMRPRPYSQPRYVTCLDLGRAGAVFTQGWDRVPTMTGETGKQMKQRINRSLIYPPTGSAEEIFEASRIPG